jgi:hypothetical protein
VSFTKIAVASEDSRGLPRDLHVRTGQSAS